MYSFRCIVGESAPHGLVTDPLAVDKKLVPLWRSMARYADLSAQVCVIKLHISVYIQTMFSVKFSRSH